MVGSHQLAGEAETGTPQDLAHALHQPRRRAHVEVGVAVIYLAIGLALVFVGGLAAGALAFGVHAPALLSGGTVSVATGCG